MKKEQRESYTEVLTILNYMETEYQQKIPKKLIDFFERNSAKDYKFNIDLAIPLKEQKLKAKTLSLLAMLNLNYWCENEEEKQKLMKKYSENEERHQEELREKYNPDDIFKSKRKIKTEEQSEEKSLNVVQEEKWYQKIFNIIKGLFKRK